MRAVFDHIEVEGDISMGCALMPILGQAYSNNPNVTMVSGGSVLAAIAIPLLIILALCVVAIAGMWKVFTKAGQPGWACIVPIYNIIVMIEIAGKPLWWIALFFIPFVNFVPAIFIPIEIANHFGKGAGFGVGLIFLPFIFYPILGFGDAQYMHGSFMPPQGFAPVMPQA
jgi:hypothetical protein